MKDLKICACIFIIRFIPGLFCESIVLTPTQANVNLNEAFTFTCTYIGYGEVAGTKWNIEKTYTPYIVRHQNGTCSGGGIFNGSTIYRVGCPSDTSFTVTLLRVQLDDHNVQWICFDRVRNSNTVTIYVQVPVVNVSLHLVGPSSSFIKEHSRQTIKCKTSPGRPQPNISWYLYEANNNVKHKITVNSSIQIISSGAGLASVESTLQFYPNRSIHEWMLNCEAWTNNETRSLQSKRLTLNIAYPPDRPPVISGFENGDKYPLIESEIGKLSCTTHGGNPLATLTWKCYNNKPESTTIKDKNVSSTVTWSGFRDQSSCTCISNHSWSKTTQTTTIVIDVLYSPNKPTLTISNTDVSNVINVILNNTVHVKCESKSKPHPTYSWTGPADMQITIQILNVTIFDTKDRKYKCIATNRMVRQNGTYVDGRNESDVTIKVLYPPGKPNFKYEYSNGTKVSTQNKIDVIAGDSFSIHCHATGNPQPTNRWDSNEGNDILKITSITFDANTTCHAMYTMEETVGERRTGSTSASFFIRVLYPPHIPKFTISNGTRQVNVTTATIQLKETDNINITCFSDGKPVPKYTWTSNNVQIHENIRQFANIIRNDAGKYTCNASNVMERSFGDTEHGLNVSSIYLDILYPSTISSLEDINILEGSDLNETCRVQKGNPTKESVSWTRISDDTNWKNSQLIIINVSRADDTNYTCTLRSTIIPTIGDETLTIRSKTIHLNIFFSSEIKHFTVVKDKSSGTFIVNQRDEVSLECTAEANPASILSIYNTRDTMISTVKNRNVLLYSINNVSYENAGKYKCEGRNKYTKDKPSVSELTMIVKCSPRPSLAIKFPNKIAAAQYTNKTLNFVAYEYLDVENKTKFMWLHKNISIDRNDEKFEIISIGLNSTLSVKNITKMEFGEYSVKVSNTIGEYIHYYILQAEDKPDVPINLTYKSGSITKSSVTLVWTPGFDGGFPQTFILLYQYNQEEKWHSVQVQDTNEQTIKYTLTGLLSFKLYNITMFSMNKKGNSSFTKNLQITTKINVKTADSQSSDNVGIIGGSISGVAVVMMLSILLAVLFLKRRNKKETDGLYQNVPFIGNSVSNKKKRKSETKHEKETTFEDLQEVDDVPTIVSEITEYSNSPEIIEQIDRIGVSELYAYVCGRKDTFEIEYQQKLPTGLQKPCTFARKPENIALNRYNGIYPYDHSRVKVHGDAAFFINACYIDGYRHSRRYIASLGPTSKTTNDFETFWQMIWHEKSDLIVMLTNLREHSGMKCEQYWPNEASLCQYGHVTVTSKNTEVFAEYTVRTFTVSKENEHRLLTHLHYTAWPDKTVPEDVTTLLEFRKILKSTPTTSEGPMVVHCSAGIGRTGTLIAIDRLIEEGLDKGSVNVFECVKSMREQRVKMVQTLEQYIYIHKALVMALTFRAEAVPIEQIREYVNRSNEDMFSMLFQLLQQTIETDSEAEQKARIKNKERSGKNRRGADTPGSRFSIFLHLNREGDESEYINAVYINSFKKKDHFIAAQSPLPSTVEDFLALIYQENCSCIVAMEDLNEPGMTVGMYLPEEKKTLTVGNFKVSCSRLETKKSHIIRKMKIKYTGKYESGERSIIHFQYTQWIAENDIPGNTSEFVQFANEVEEYANELGDEKSPVVVHCLKANERSGLFCGVIILMEKIKHERRVNIIDSLRHLRTRRPSAITSQKQLEFCYQAASAYTNLHMKNI